MKAYRMKGLLLGLAAGAFVFTGTAMANTKHHYRHHRTMMYPTCQCVCLRDCYDHWPELMKDDPRYHREDMWRTFCYPPGYWDDECDYRGHRYSKCDRDEDRDDD